MSKIIPKIEDLIDRIQEEFAWRRKELKIITDRIPRERSPLQSAYLRSAIPLLYAHWEGFVKNSSELYLKYIAGKFSKHSELFPQFFALSLNKKIGNQEIKSLGEKANYISTILEEKDKNSNIPTKNVIHTKSNLNFNAFSDILYTLNISVDKFLKYQGLVDDLVETRNFIAHGDSLNIDYPTLVKYNDEIISLMEYYRTTLENAALLEEFKKI